MRKQQGLATLEFAILGSTFFLMLFGVLEISRLLFTWNTLDAITQRTARVAAVCPPNDAAVKSVGMFGNSGSQISLVPGMTAQNIAIDYLDENFVSTGGAYPISYVRVSIVNYSIDLAIPFVDTSGLLSPDFSFTVPSESLGFIPDTGARACTGA